MAPPAPSDTITGLAWSYLNVQSPTLPLLGSCGHAASPVLGSPTALAANIDATTRSLRHIRMGGSFGESGHGPSGSGARVNAARTRGLDTRPARKRTPRNLRSIPATPDDRVRVLILREA